MDHVFSDSNFSAGTQKNKSGKAVEYRYTMEEKEKIIKGGWLYLDDGMRDDLYLWNLMFLCVLKLSTIYMYSCYNLKWYIRILQGTSY